ncbi:MAG: hypothetical protein ACXWZE_09135 [Candidatus Binatia bacterium]
MIVRKVGLSILLIATLLRPGASLLAAEMATVAQPPSLCRAEEQIIFTCVAAGSAKVASLCGSRLLDHRRGYLQYRYGNPGAIELQFPQARANTQLAFRYAHYFRAQVDRTEISFDNQDSRYILFDYYDGDVKPVVAVAGVRVGKHGTKGWETELRCRSRPASKLGSLETVIPRDHDNALNQ